MHFCNHSKRLPKFKWKPVKGQEAENVSFLRPRGEKSPQFVKSYDSVLSEHFSHFFEKKSSHSQPSAIWLLSGDWTPLPDERFCCFFKKSIDSVKFERKAQSSL
uniref:Uncharacterized protein n=1 Tax=Romanomermis culicivorax TaxID=13658 RepID=A0A915JYY8_ROMCU